MESPVTVVDQETENMDNSNSECIHIFSFFAGSDLNSFRHGQMGAYNFVILDKNSASPIIERLDPEQVTEARLAAFFCSYGQVTFSFFPFHRLMELELKKMFDTVQSIHDEMFYLRERNAAMAFEAFL
ncbi:hypothetical protein BUALT_Bualt19G0062600 [Buddleja alternifolia]|uniref:Uncharacterized protein n=1 Tax=Buddleja alternifolia TaxID=168488 RepID=A0AAV6W7J5_9LAMI|nr:hypothetical protein BUALT_Bualt19G0062600 [Buddleja alternifolia]